MPPADNIESHLSTVERDVAQLRQQLALAAGADHDVSEVRAHTQALNALRETQLEQSHKIEELGRIFKEQSGEMREGFATLATGVAQITALLTNLGEAEGLT